MSSKYDHPIGDAKEGQEDIQLVDQVTTWTCREACTSRAQTEVDTFEHKIGVNEGTELLNKTEKAMKTSSGSTDDFIKIQQVPRIMLQNEDFREYFKPRELSIGPIHADDPNLFKMELKLKLAAYFIKESGKTKDDFLKQIKTGIKDIKTCFDEEAITSYTDDQLIWLLFLDGCAMLGFVHCFVNRRLNELTISNGQAALIQQDLFLLENQIPFKVLALLMGIGGSQPIYRRSIDKSQKDFFKFVIASNVINFPRDLKDLKRLFKKIDRDRNPVHVLDLLRD
ncbi:hypothetical protein TIFTF001_043440 [Ficus carica]|uniref:Uncharacterized protein n=1 Tax=Ficus carica TaxID=3494 RepID=A0AA87YZF8_FICCA|nr:hypothetical protein TIFTF001_043440 [Ficus carica]